MAANKKVNRLFLCVVVLFLGASLLINQVLPFSIPDSAAMVLSEALILIPALVYLAIQRIPLGTLVPFRGIRLSVCVLIVISTYLLYPLLVVLNLVTLFFVESGTSGLSEITGGDSFLAATVLVAVLPAFAEEFLFRGVLYGTYRKSRMVGGIFLSAFLFGCMHMNFNQFLYAFVLGIYLAFLVEATGSILSSMLAHFTINFTSVLMSQLLYPRLQQASQELAGVGDSMDVLGGKFLSGTSGAVLLVLVMELVVWGVIALGTTAGAVGIYIGICHITGRWVHVKSMFSRKKGPGLWSVALAAAVVLMVGVILWKAII